MKHAPIFVQNDRGDLDDMHNRGVAWIAYGRPECAYIEGPRTAEELHAIADWLDVKNGK